MGESPLTRSADHNNRTVLHLRSPAYQFGLRGLSSRSITRKRSGGTNQPDMVL